MMVLRTWYFLGLYVLWFNGASPFGLLCLAPCFMLGKHVCPGWEVDFVVIKCLCVASLACKDRIEKFPACVKYLAAHHSRLSRDQGTGQRALQGNQVICPLGRPRQDETTKESVRKLQTQKRSSLYSPRATLVHLPAMAASCLPEETQDHRSAAWRQGVRARLAKKATFEAAVADLEKALSASPAAASDPAIAELVERSFTLLRTRYTAPGFWSAGRALYASALKASQLTSSLFTHQL